MNLGTDSIKYPSYDQVLWLYDRVVEISDGGIKGFRDEGELLYVLDTVKNDDYFPTFISKLSFLIHRVCDGHIFKDGNKRMGLAIGGLFLQLNGLYKSNMMYIQRMEAITYHIAAGNINENLLIKVLESIINRKDYDEELKYELYAAFDKMKAKFPDFIKSVTDCSNYLSNTVAPAYEKVEATASSKIG